MMKMIMMMMIRPNNDDYDDDETFFGFWFSRNVQGQPQNQMMMMIARVKDSNVLTRVDSSFEPNPEIFNSLSFWLWPAGWY